MSRVIFVAALLALSPACGGQSSEQAAPSAPSPAPVPVAPAEPAPALAPATPEPTAPAAEPEAPAEPAPSADKPVGGSSTKTGEPTGKKPAAAKPEEPAPVVAAEKEKPAAPTASTGPCGEEGQPMCPLQAFMERFVQEPMEDGDLDAVGKGLARAAKLAPEPSWNAGASGWSAIAQAGADAASQGDEAATKQSCKTCHKAFRAKYKAEHRAKPL